MNAWSGFEAWPAGWCRHCAHCCGLAVQADRRRKQRRRELLSRLAGEQNQRCAYCAVRFDEAGPGSRATLEHLSARTHGGVDSWDNCVAACADCNGARGTENPGKFYRRLKAAALAGVAP